MKSFKIREIEERDDAAVESVIRSCLIEYGANHEGTAWSDPSLPHFSRVYNTKRDKYWVAEDENGKIVGGVGIGALSGEDSICELQKMYCLPEVRGTGIAHELISLAIEHAAKFYSGVYLETCDNMYRAQRFYEKHGFRRTPRIANTGHFGCEFCYILDLK